MVWVWWWRGGVHGRGMSEEKKQEGLTDVFAGRWHVEVVVDSLLDLSLMIAAWMMLAASKSKT